MNLFLYLRPKRVQDSISIDIEIKKSKKLLKKLISLRNSSGQISWVPKRIGSHLKRNSSIFICVFNI